MKWHLFAKRIGGFYECSMSGYVQKWRWRLGTHGENHGEITQPNYSPEFQKASPTNDLHLSQHVYHCIFSQGEAKLCKKTLLKLRIAVCTIHVQRISPFVKSLGWDFFSRDANSSLWTLVTAGNKKPHGSPLQRKVSLRQQPPGNFRTKSMCLIVDRG